MHASRCQARCDRRRIAAALGVALPQERGDAFEAARGDQLFQRMAAHDQPARLAIDLAHHRVRHDHPVEATIHPSLQHWISFPSVAATVASWKYIVTLDYIHQYTIHVERMAEFPGSGATARRVSGDAL